MCLKYRNLKIAILAYIALPALIFAAGYLRWYAAVPAVLCLAYGFARAIGENTADRYAKELKIGRRQLAALAVIILIWTYLGGLNGLFYQSSDWSWRNAIFHDLVDMDWPVIYEERNSALVYYIGFWLPPALVAKLTGVITGSAIWVWRAARGALWLWSSLGLMLAALALMFFAGADTRRKQWLVTAVFVLFSGMDIIGAIYSGRIGWLLEPDVMHLEWWALGKRQYSAITTCIYWVFNQSIIPWLATACFLMEKNARNYVFLGMACMCSGPLPFVGLVVCMVFRWICDMVSGFRSGQLKCKIKEAFSLPNMLLIAAVFPVLGAYFMSNLAVANTVSENAGLSLMERISGYLTRDFIVFFLLDAGIYLALIWHRQRKNPLFYIVAASLFAIPYFQVGGAEDFCMRASIPGIFILMAFCADYLANELPGFRKSGIVKKAVAVCLICALLVGAVTPAMEIYRGIYHAVTKKTIHLAQDAIGSVNNHDSAANFTAADYGNTFFFKYFARRP